MDLVMECESFIKDCDLLYSTYLVESFSATEGERMEKVKAAGRFAWQKIKELARKAAEFVQNVASAILNFIGKVIPALNKTGSQPIDPEVLKAAGFSVFDYDKFEYDKFEYEKFDAVSQAASNLSRVKEVQEEQAEAVEKACSQLDELTDKLLKNLNEKSSDKSLDSMLPTDSFMSIAMEAGGLFNVGDFKAKSARALKGISDKLKKATAASKAVKASVDASANDGSDDTASNTKKASLLAKCTRSITKAASALRQFGAFIGGNIRAFFSALRKSREKSTTEKYEGPEPTLA